METTSKVGQNQDQDQASQAKKKHAELMEMFSEADTCDKELFSEMRSNILLISGDHYAKMNAKMINNIRSRQDIPTDQKIRLVKNHTQKIVKSYVNSIMSKAPGVHVFPNNPSELQDKKAAELHQAVLENGKIRYRLKEKIRSYCEDYVGIGEAHVKLFWDPSKGDLVGFHQAVDEEGTPLFEQDENGNPVLDAEGQPKLKAGERAAFGGDFVFERIFGFNLLRAPEAKSLDESPYLINRKMVDIKVMKKRYQGNQEKMKMLNSEQDRTYVVFDAQNGTYSKQKNQIMLREQFFRPCEEYPKGYFYFYVEGGILEEGELPEGEFPIISTAFEKIQTSPRGRGPVKHIRPYQVEINRAGSKISEHQITLGDDKVVMVNGSKMEQGGIAPGIRGYRVTGSAPTVIPGRDGSQYLGTLQSTIAELYNVMGVDEITMEKSGEVDPYSMLFRAASQKALFTSYIERFEQFLIDLVTLFLKLAKVYYPDDMVVHMVGRSEQVNMAEYKEATDLGFQIRVEPVSEDVETRLGKQLVMMQAIQYGGQNLKREDIGRILSKMPFAGMDDAFDDFTQDEKRTENIILALDRGKQLPMHSYDDHPFMIQKLTHRMCMPDFDSMPPQIQQMYQDRVNQHEQFDAQNQAKIMAAKNEFIPTSGALVACDIYVQQPGKPDSNKRARIPYDALTWLLKRIELQGTSLEELETMNPTAAGQVGSQAAAQVHGQVPQGVPGQQPQALAGQPN